MKRVVTLIPTRRNDGSPVSQAERDAILTGLWTRFGGLTIDGIVSGHWIDGGRHYEDESLKVSVVCERSRVAELAEAIRGIGKQLEQVAMYFEVCEVGMGFLRCD